MNSNKKLTPRDGDSTVISHILTSGRTPVVVMIDETKINVTLLEKAKSGSNGGDQTRGKKNMYIAQCTLFENSTKIVSFLHRFNTNGWRFSFHINNFYPWLPHSSKSKAPMIWDFIVTGTNFTASMLEIYNKSSLKLEWCPLVGQVLHSATPSYTTKGSCRLILHLSLSAWGPSDHYQGTTGYCNAM